MGTVTIATGNPQKNCNQALTRTSDGYLHTVYTRVVSNRTQVFYSYSDDEGATWNETQLTTDSYNKDNPGIACGSDDSIHVAWVAYSASYSAARNVRYRKKPSGSGWDSITDITNGTRDQRFTSIAVNSNDYIHIVWSGKTSSYPSYYQLRHRVYTDSWQSVEEVSTENYHHMSPNLEIDGDDYLQVVWHGHQPTSSVYASANYTYYNGSVWSPFEVVFSDASYDRNDAHIAIDSSDDQHMTCSGGSAAYGGTRNGYYRKRTSGSWGTIYWLSTESSGYTNQTTSISVETNDDIHATWRGKHSGSTTYHQVRHKEYSGSWGSIENLTSDSVDSQWINLIFSIYPTIHQCIPRNEYAFSWLSGTVYKYYYHTDLGWEWYSSLDESITIADVVDNTLIPGILYKLLTETLDISDSISFGFSKVLTESLSISDSITKQLALVKILTESLSISDSITTQRALGLILSESLSISDTFSRTVEYYRTFGELLDISDSISFPVAIVGDPTLSPTLKLLSSGKAYQLRNFTIKLSADTGSTMSGEVSEELI